MRTQFWTLYKKELREGAPFGIVIGILLTGLIVFLSAMSPRWGENTTFALSFMPLVIIPFYALFQGFTAYRSEWKEDTVYTLMSLPVPGWFFSLTKWLATMTYFTAFTLLNLALILLFYWRMTFTAFETVPGVIGLMQMIKVFILIYLAYWLGSAISYIIGQFSFLTSRLVNKGKAIIGGITVLTSFWIFFRLGGLLTGLLGWLPDLHVGIWNYDTGYYARLDLAPWIALILVAAGLIYLGAWMLERILEV